MSILELFQSLDPAAPSVILCTRIEHEELTVMAYKSSDHAWQHCADPVAGSNQELNSVTDKLGWAMPTYPVPIAGFIYQMFVNYNADHGFQPRSELIRQLQMIAKAHDRTFSVAPQAEVLDLLNSIPSDKATLKVSIEFKERIYTILTWHCRTEGGIEMLKIDPAAFESALRSSGWRQIQPPVHQVGKLYHVLIERSEGERYLITDETDVQTWRKRENSLTAHFVLVHA